MPEKYYKKIFLYLLGTVLWNSFLLCKNVVGKRIAFLEFRIQVVEDLSHKYDDTASGQKNPDIPPTVDNSGCLTERHFKSHISPTPVKRQPTRHCKVSSSKMDTSGKNTGKEIRFCCNNCGVGLCLEKGFQLYYRKLNH
ncbi:piggyBac transposable element-derived protein 4 [Trichonephila clavipes]|nr:piggyBac transposable element-derived protein 4 [Trichonephila clavipes]